MPTVLLCSALFGGAFLGGLVPLVNVELLLLGAVVLAPPALELLLALVATVGHMIGKLILYRGGSELSRWSRNRAGPRVDRLIDRLERRPEVVHSTFLASAFSGLPPFYLMTLAAGGLGVRPKAFLILGTLGRFVRFYLIVLSPRLLEYLP